MALTKADLAKKVADACGFMKGEAAELSAELDAAPRTVYRDLEAIRESRIPAEVSFHDEIGFQDIIRRPDLISRYSVHSDLVLIPLPYEGSAGSEMQRVFDKTNETIERIPSVLFVRGRAYIDLKE